MNMETDAPQAGTASSGQSRPAQLVERAGEEAGNVAETATDGIREVADERAHTSEGSRRSGEGNSLTGLPRSDS